MSSLYESIVSAVTRTAQRDRECLDDDSAPSEEASNSEPAEIMAVSQSLPGASSQEQPEIRRSSSASSINGEDLSQESVLRKRIKQIQGDKLATPAEKAKKIQVSRLTLF